MIQIDIDNTPLSERRSGQAIEKVRLTIDFEATPAGIAELRKVIDRQAPLNPGVSFEVVRRGNDEFCCSACGDKVFVPYGSVPNPCKCNHPRTRWMKREL